MNIRPPAPHAITIGTCIVAEPVRLRQFGFANRRLLEIGSLIRLRHGVTLPLTDDVDFYLVPLANHLAVLFRASGQSIEVATERIAERMLIWAPEYPIAAARNLAVAAMLNRTKWTAADLGDRLALKPHEREGLGIQTIRPAGMRGRSFEEYRKARERERAEERRRAAGVTSRAEAKANLDAEIVASGLSRRTFFRRKQQSAQQNGTRTSGPISLDSPDFPVPSVLHSFGPDFPVPKNVARNSPETAAEEARRLGVHRSTVLRRRRNAADETTGGQ